MVQSLRNAGSDVASSLRVWQTEGCALHAVGKALTGGLYSVLAWQPNGRHLYAAHAQGRHHRVVLYETNGLEHGGFDVPRSGLSLLDRLKLGFQLANTLHANASIPCFATWSATLLWSC